jgi:hypothetical protein
MPCDPAEARLAAVLQGIARLVAIAFQSATGAMASPLAGMMARAPLSFSWLLATSL